MGYKIVVNEYSNLQGLNSTKVLVSEYAAIGTKTTKVIVVEDTNIGSSAYNEAKAAAVTATNAANQATATLANAVVKSNPISDVAQGTAVNSLTRKDYVDSLGKGKITTSITLPSGSPATGYIPVIFEGIGSSADIYISTAGGSGSIPMNNCSFNGIVRASGWGDGVSYCTGMFTIYQTNERAIHSVHGPSESTNAAVFFVETRAFPITVSTVSGVTVRASASNLTYGTSVFAVNGQEGVGNTKTMTLANFASGTGIYKGSSIVQNQDEQDARYLLKGGDTMTGQLVVSQSGNSSIVINSTTSNDSQLQFQNQGKLRWLIQRDAVVESGSNVGSDLNLFGYNDDGTFGGSVLKVRRSTRQVEFQTQPLSIATQSTSQYALTRRDFVEAQTALKVSKSGDTMSGSLTFSQAALGVGVKIENSAANGIAFGNGLFAGNGDGASETLANIQLKSWYGIGIAPSTGNPNNTNNIWFNARNGDISTKGGLIAFGTGAAITLKVPTGASNIVLGQTGSDSTWSNNWYVGRGSGTSDDVQLYSYVYGTNLTLASDRISSNKPLYAQGYKVLSELDEKVWKNRGQQSDLGLASAVLPGYFSFNPGASSSPDVAQYGHGFAVNPGSNGAAGVWSSQFAVTHGTPNKLWHRSGINGAAQGNWKKIYTSDDHVGTVSQSSGVPTGAIIERGTFAGGEYVKYSDGTMMQWGRLSISNKAVTSAAGVLFQSAAIDTVTYGPAFVGNPSPSALFLYSSGGARPWPVLTSSTATYASFVLQCGMSVSAMAGDYVWQVMGRWF
ncbi:tail fiber protein [Aeromonas caviae]|uniref:tail fiber protein n=1 Tax=Aeromonas caviae TaxID=648 RepID=UPI002AB58F02|nr:tail fiber protein [Aeromonas caviae]MDY7828157.1 tail fiber protein [Aeromonas caviae]